MIAAFKVPPENPKREYIDREAVIKSCCNACDGYCECVECDCLSCKLEHRCDMIQELADFPAADVREVKRGEWIEAHNTLGQYFERCSECGTYIESIYFANDYNVNFCPNCGARMEEQT